MRSLLIFLAISLFGLWAQCEPTLFMIEGTNNDSTKYQGRVLRALTGYRISETFNLEASVDDLERTYPGDVKVHDAIFAAQLVSRASAHIYLENAYAKSTTNSIYAIWSTRSSVHYTTGNEDFGLGFRYDEFLKSLAGTLNPSYFHSFTDAFGIGASIFAVRTSSWDSAYQLQLAGRFDERHSLRVFGASGRTIEDAGLVAEFRSFTARYLYDLGSHWQIGAGYTDYWSAVRNERSISVTLGYR